MALSDSPREQNKKRPVRRIDAGSNFRWSDKQKLEAVTSYLALGNLALTARLMGIPEVTLRSWKASEWWPKLVEELKLQERIELSNRMKRMIDAAHVVVEQRLTNGDPFINNKTGNIDYKPVALRDAHRVAVDLLNQRDTVERVNAPVEKRESTHEDQLKQLAEKFADFATKRIEQTKRPVLVTDVIFAEEIPSAIHDQREEGLQEGSEVGEDDTPTTGSPES